MKSVKGTFFDKFIDKKEEPETESLPFESIILKQAKKEKTAAKKVKEAEMEISSENVLSLFSKPSTPSPMFKKEKTVTKENIFSEPEPVFSKAKLISEERKKMSFRTDIPKDVLKCVLKCLKHKEEATEVEEPVKKTKLFTEEEREEKSEKAISKFFGEELEETPSTPEVSKEDPFDWIPKEEEKKTTPSFLQEPEEDDSIVDVQSLFSFKGKEVDKPKTYF